MSDDDSPLQSDEEEMLVYVDFAGTVGPKTFTTEKLQLHMLGLDMERPIMQINDKFYEGTYEDAIGTCMFFEKDQTPTVDDPVFDKTPTTKFHSKTKKILKMKRIFVKPRLEVLGDSNHPDCIPNLETLQKAGVPPQYWEAALSMWEQKRNERLQALNEYLEKQKRRKQLRAEGKEPESESDEDNPFAMYRPESEEPSFDGCEPMQVDEPQELKSVPSTSKECVPTTSSEAEPAADELPEVQGTSSDAPDKTETENPVPSGTET